MSNREKFGILLWKNWRLKIHRPVRTMCEILLPVLAVFLLVIARQFLPSKTVFSVAYNEFQPDLELISTYHIAYAPETSPIVKEIMESVKNKLNTHIQGYHSEEETITMLQLANNPHVAVIFPESYKNMTKLPKKVQFTLRFAASATPITSWKTDRLYPVIWKFCPRDREIETTPMPGYDQSGFLALQNAISEEIIEIHSNAKLVPQIYLRRFPYPDYRSDILLSCG
ncbi:ATP-binding cassette sub-family A member 17-like [Atheta coriaria]|uniref:ATP-binding cassette sub-family A member 17-like n=1 Tax=Dalotia coriaria TaxID=877792 RepID=UPI0031F3B9D0